MERKAETEPGSVRSYRIFGSELLLYYCTCVCGTTAVLFSYSLSSQTTFTFSIIYGCFYSIFWTKAQLCFHRLENLTSLCHVPHCRANSNYHFHCCRLHSGDMAVFIVAASSAGWRLDYYVISPSQWIRRPEMLCSVAFQIIVQEQSKKVSFPAIGVQYRWCQTAFVVVWRPQPELLL